MQVYTGELEGVLRGDADEILRELVGVVDAARDKSVKLTKAGIPPKPLWSAINERLLWEDPKSVMHDWDEVDQIRLLYSLAMELSLLQPDDERLLLVGPGVDAFFLQAPTMRSAMLMRAYLSMTDWDERCDARNNQGHRHNFGRTFRRDFMRHVSEVRTTVMAALDDVPAGEWVYCRDLALKLGELDPELLISEDSLPPDLDRGEVDPELERFVEYWVVLAARFGWVDLARTPETSMLEVGKRLFRKTELLDRLQEGDIKLPTQVEAERITKLMPYVAQPTYEVIFYRHEADFSDEYLLRRIAVEGQKVDWYEPTASYRVDRYSIRDAIQTGLDPALIHGRIVERCRARVPRVFLRLIEDGIGRPADVFLEQAISVVELGDETHWAELDANNFERKEELVLVPWGRWIEFVQIVGEEPSRGFRYPPEEPIAEFRDMTFRLTCDELPMIARELLNVLELDGLPGEREINKEMLTRLTNHGWTPKTVGEALGRLTGGEIPRKLATALR